MSRASQAAAGDAELRDSLAALSRLVQGQGQRGLEDMLRHVAEFAARALPVFDGAGLTLVEDDRPDTVVATAEFVREVDAIQYGIGEGPCITAAAEQRTVWSGSLGGDRAWPRFGPRAGRLGVHSVLSLPLLGPGGPLGAMNLYSHAKHALDERAIRMGELYAVPAAVTVQNAKDLAQTRRLADQLQAALASRSVIDQALGIVMSRAGCGPEEAFERLKALSQREHRKLSEVARHLVGQAAARARPGTAAAQPGRMPPRRGSTPASWVSKPTMPRALPPPGLLLHRLLPARPVRQPRQRLHRPVQNLGVRRRKRQLLIALAALR